MSKHQFYKYSEKVKKVPFFKKELEPIAQKKQAERIKEIKKEMNRVFQVANRRIENVRKSKITSSAIKSLSAEYGGNLPNRFTVFTNSGLDFLDYNQYQKALDNYSKALQFVNNPTSSSLGARRYIKNIANQYNLPFEFANELVDKIMQPEIINGAIVINNWDSDKVKQIINDFTAEYNKDVSNMSKADFTEFVSNSIYDLMNPNNKDIIDVFDL